MIKDTWIQLLLDQDVRQNLSKLRQDIKVHGGKEELIICMGKSENMLISFLKSADAKTRKNTALLMGDLAKQEYIIPIYEAYVAENQMFVKSSYLAAMKNFDYREYLPVLKERLDELTKEEMTEENQKHFTEEIRELSSMIVTMEGVKNHSFHGKEETYEVVLLTNRNFQAVTLRELKEQEPFAKIKIFNAGLMAKVQNLHWVDEVRTYQELLFVVKGMKSCPMDADFAAETIVRSDLLDFLDRGHEGEPPYYFRVEFKSKMELDKRSAFTKRLASQIEMLTERKLINTTSNYEFEIRLVENKEGGCNILLKLYTWKDERFAYRKEVIPTSMKAVNAALTVKLAENYMKEDAQVLDPFCGVGTMLIERHKAVKANTMFGLDIQEEAITKARSNTETACQIVHYVNRDFFDFKHNYLFDEIITNMPFKIGRTTKEEIFQLYEKFFPTAGTLLKKDGVIVMYSHDGEYVKKMCGTNGFVIVESFEISMKEGTDVFVLKRK